MRDEQCEACARGNERILPTHSCHWLVHTATTCLRLNCASLRLCALLTLNQTASFTGFLFLLVVAIFRTKKLALPADQHRNIRRLLCLNLLTALLVLLRTVYRLAVEIEGEL